MKFKKGDKVLCVDSGHRALIAGKVYTVAFQDKEDYVHLDEIGTSMDGWWPERFKLALVLSPVRNGREHKRMFRLEK